MKILLAGILCFSWAGVSAQNIGIGTNTPLSKLHIFSGASGFASTPFSPLVVEGSTNTYFNFLTPNGSESGVLFGKASDAASGGIIYNNSGNLNGLQFRTNGNTTRMIIDNSGRVGIGITPTISDGVFEVNGRMRIRSGGSLGNSAGLWLNNTNNSAQAAFFGMEDDTHVGFFGSSSGWSLTMNTVTGRVGIGITNPNAPLSFPPALGKKITLYPGATGDVGFGVAGNCLQIYSDNPNADVALGYDAAGVFNERFAVKPNGALALSGNTGNTGQILSSNGSGSATTWTDNPVSTMYSQTEEIAATNTLNLLSSPQQAGVVPGLSKTIVLTKTSKVVVRFQVMAFSTPCAFCGVTTFDMYILLNGGNTGYIRHYVDNGASITTSGMRIFTLGPGTHTIDIAGFNLTGPTLQLAITPPTVYPSFLFIEVIPQN